MKEWCLQCKQAPFLHLLRVVHVAWERTRNGNIVSRIEFGIGKGKSFSDSSQFGIGIGKPFSDSSHFGIGIGKSYSDTSQYGIGIGKSC